MDGRLAGRRSRQGGRAAFSARLRDRFFHVSPFPESGDGRCPEAAACRIFPGRTGRCVARPVLPDGPPAWQSACLGRENAGEPVLAAGHPVGGSVEKEDDVVWPDDVVGRDFQRAKRVAASALDEVERPDAVVCQRGQSVPGYGYFADSEAGFSFMRSGGARVREGTFSRRFRGAGRACRGPNRPARRSGRGRTGGSGWKRPVREESPVWFARLTMARSCRIT
ncbi:hypothetical protein OFAG_02187 [Oxalobacter formigenes HOxBLS]|uniref:Uncharacterized protein n=1 Tax=Oxalobacter paraformigenes TaxID=556268 RepID=T5LEH0_9BURK|nr:hypothetical protein OFAG_02187 [Oxalobacter paraformigenes]